MLDVYSLLISYGTMILIYCCLGMMAVSICRRYDVQKVRAFSAVGFSLAVLGPLFVAVPTLAYYFTVYSATAKKGPMTR